MVAHCRQHGLRRLPRGGQNLHGLRGSPVQQIAGRARGGARRGTVGLNRGHDKCGQVIPECHFGLSDESERPGVLKIALRRFQEALMMLIDLDLAETRAQADESASD